MHMYPVAGNACPQPLFQAPAAPLNPVVSTTALTAHAIAISSGTACSARDSCRSNLDACETCVWLGEQATAAARHRTAAGGNSSCTRYHAATPAAPYPQYFQMHLQPSLSLFVAASFLVFHSPNADISGTNPVSGDMQITATQRTIFVIAPRTLCSNALPARHSFCEY